LLAQPGAFARFARECDSQPWTLWLDLLQGLQSLDSSERDNLLHVSEYVREKVLNPATAEELLEEA